MYLHVSHNFPHFKCISLALCELNANLMWFSRGFIITEKFECGRVTHVYFTIHWLSNFRQFNNVIILSHIFVYTIFVLIFKFVLWAKKVNKIDTIFCWHFSIFFPPSIVQTKLLFRREFFSCECCKIVYQNKKKVVEPAPIRASFSNSRHV